MVEIDDYRKWNAYMQTLGTNSNLPYFKEREVWWTAAGINVGHEENGKGEQFSRPVLILKKYGKHTFCGIPLSTTDKVGKYYFHFSFMEGKNSTALIGHINTYDSLRLIKKFGIVEKTVFELIRKAAKDLL